MSKVYSSLNYQPTMFGLPTKVCIAIWGGVTLIAFATNAIYLLFIGSILHPLVFYLYIRDQFILEILKHFFSRKTSYVGSVEQKNIKKYRQGSLIMDEISFSQFVDTHEYPGVIIHTSEKLSRTYKIYPQDCITKTESEIERAVSQVNNAITKLDSNWNIHVSMIRIPMNQNIDFIESQPKNSADFYKQNEQKTMSVEFQNQYYLTLMYRIKDRKENIWKKLFGGGSQETEEEAIIDIVQRFMSQSDDFTFRLRRNFSIEIINDSEILSYLWKELCLENKIYTTHDINSIDIAKQYDSGIIETGNVIKVEDRLLGVLGIGTFPPYTHYAMFEDVGFQYPVKVTFNFSPWSKNQSRKRLEDNRRRWGNRRYKNKKAFRDATGMSGDTPEDINIEAVHMIDDAEEAISEISTSSVTFGSLRATIVFDGGDDAYEYKTREDEIYTYLQELGFDPIRESRSLNADMAYWATIPGKESINVRKHFISSANFSDLFPLSAPFSGLSYNSHLAKISGVGDPTIRCITHNLLGYNLNLNAGGKDVGNTFIAGAVGSGKSVLLSTIALSWLRYPESRVIIFDKGGSSLPATALAGGDYIEPFHIDNTMNFSLFARFMELSEEYNQTKNSETKLLLDEEVLFLVEFLCELAEINDVEIAPEDRTTLKHIIEQSYQKQENYIKYMNSLIRSNQRLQDLYHVLEQYQQGGVFGTLLDSPKEFKIDSHWTTFEMDIIMDKGHKALIPVLLYLFHRINQLINDLRPTIIILDEAWIFFKNPVFLSKLEEWLRTFRKKNVFLITATQDVIDINNDIANILKTNCPTKIFLPNPNAVNPGISESYEMYGLSDIDISIIASATPKQDYYVTSSDHSRLINLNLTPEMIALFSSLHRKDFYINMIKEELPFHERYEKIKQKIWRDV